MNYRDYVQLSAYCAKDGLVTSHQLCTQVAGLKDASAPILIDRVKL